MLLGPLLVLGGLEGVLRLSGYGYSTALFEKVRVGGEDFLMNNETFSLRFFPPELARWPSPIMMPAKKPPGAYRIFIFGESAAQGDPSPPYGAGRYLEALLRERYPGQNFEVVNVAITAINSHVILPIARECARQEGDLWIIYMGNNEMIGPFGAASVFGAQAPPWPLVRLGLAVQQTRAGQWMMNLARRLKAKSSGPQVWGGLAMFLGHQLPPDDPRKEVVYKNFERNVRDIVRAGLDSGAKILLNTVAVNLKDCPPFASIAPANLPPVERETCDRLYAEGLAAEDRGDFPHAAELFREAAGLAPQRADAEFHLAESLWQSTQSAEARAHFQKACDNDALPFRADSRINHIIEETAHRLAGPDLKLCDTLALGSPLGQETFYEHVHFNFDGNYRLARLWAGEIEPFLPSPARSNPPPEWASQEVCEQRLGLTDWNRCDVFHEVLQRMEKAPLDSQSNNRWRMGLLQAQLDRIRPHLDASAAQKAREVYLGAMARAPRDYYLAENYGEFLQLRNDVPEAVAAWRKALELMPRNPFACLVLGRLLEEEGQLDAARSALREAIALHADYSEAWFELGKVDAIQGAYAAALENYQHAGRLQPNNPETCLYAGKALSLLKRSAEAVQNFRRAIELNPGYWEAHYALGGELGMHDQIAGAKTEFEQVVRAQPDLAKGHLNLGVALLKLNDFAGAEQQFTETLRLDPSDPSAKKYLAVVASAKKQPRPQTP